MNRVGDRVGAVLGVNDGIVELFGYGIYEGDFIPEGAAGFWGEMCRKCGRGSPRIRLDSGKVVYGCECWWGPEEVIKKRLKQYRKVVETDIDKIREDYLSYKRISP